MATHAGSILRSITYRLSTAAPAHLPYLIRPVVAALVDCRLLLSSSSPADPSKSSDSAILHNFRTYITALASSKDAQARFAALTIIKTVIELGGWATLQARGGALVRALIAMLTKPADPPAVKKLVVVTLTRVFMLTHDFPTLVREITTPALPAYINACLGLVSLQTKSESKQRNHLQRQSLLLQPILESFRVLLPQHPTIFRSYMSPLRLLLLPLIAPTPSHVSIPPHMNTSDAQQHSSPTTTIHAAQSLFIHLHFCAPKNNACTDWVTTFDSIIVETHATANLVFRAVHEEWTSAAGASRPPASNPAVAVSNASDSLALGTPSWSNIHAGCERLHGLLGLLRICITSHTAGSITFGLGRVVDLLHRIISVTVPPERNQVDHPAALKVIEGLRVDLQISKDEREGLFAGLPSIHTEAVGVVHALCVRLGIAGIPVLTTLMEHILWTFRHEQYNLGLRAQCYLCVAKFLEIAGPAMNKDRISLLVPILSAACYDILPISEISSAKVRDQSTGTKQPSKAGTGSLTINVDSFLQSPKARLLPQANSITPLVQNAYRLLAIALLKLPADHIPPMTRSLLDRTAILSTHQPSLLASVLNPPSSSALAKTHSSILPLLAHAGSLEVGVEGLLRPRMPALQNKYDNVEAQAICGEADDELDIEWGSAGSHSIDECGKMSNGPASGVQQVPAATTPSMLGPIQNLSDGSTEMDEEMLDTPVDRSVTDALSKTKTVAKMTSPVDDTTTGHKRTAMDTDAVNSESKRAKLGSDAYLVPSLSAVAPVPERSGHATQPVPSSFKQHPNEDSRNEQPIMVPSQTMAASGLVGVGDERDDDEFEIPEINMDPDTEEEDRDSEQDDQDELGQP